MNKGEKITRINLELRVGRQDKILLIGSCDTETPKISTPILWHSYRCFVPKGSICAKELLGEATLSKKYSQLMDYAYEHFPGRTYQIKYKYKREK